MKMKWFRMSASTRIGTIVNAKERSTFNCIYRENVESMEWAIFCVSFLSIRYLYSLIVLISMQFGFLLHRLHLYVTNKLLNNPSSFIKTAKNESLSLSRFPFIILDWPKPIKLVWQKNFMLPNIQRYFLLLLF